MLVQRPPFKNEEEDPLRVAFQVADGDLRIVQEPGCYPAHWHCHVCKLITDVVLDKQVILVDMMSYVAAKKVKLDQLQRKANAVQDRLTVLVREMDRDCERNAADVFGQVS